VVPLAEKMLLQLKSSFLINSTAYRVAAYIIARKHCGQLDIEVSQKKQLVIEIGINEEQLEKAVREVEASTKSSSGKNKPIRAMMHATETAFVIENKSSKKRPTEIPQKGSVKLSKISSGRGAVVVDELEESYVVALNDPSYIAWKMAYVIDSAYYASPFTKTDIGDTKKKSPI
jgi:chorismate synthase